MTSRSQYDPAESIAFAQTRLDYLPLVAARFDHYRALLLPSEKERNLLHEDAKRCREREDRIKAEDTTLDELALEVPHSVTHAKDELDRWLRETVATRTAIEALLKVEQPAGKRDIAYLVGDMASNRFGSPSPSTPSCRSRSDSRSP